MSSGFECAHILVKGRVQGVGYRYYATTRASLHSISGYVRNLPDGGVEVVAVGRRKAIEQFIGDLSEGPTSGHVRDCQVQWQSTDAHVFGDFTIRY